MDIAVLIKQVPISNDVSVDPETHALVRENSESMINPADLNAIEEALVLKEQNGGKVVVFTMAPPDAEKSLRDAMAIGCDESCLVTDRAFAGGDTVATAKVLVKAIETYGKFDLVLCGALSSDGGTGQVGAMVAEVMNVPHMCEVQSMKYDEANAGKIEAVKKVHGHNFQVRCALPAVVSVNYGINEPRLATLRAKRAAKTKPMAVYTNKELQLEASEVGLAGSPTIAVDSYEPKGGKRAEMLTGTTAELAAAMKRLIEEEKGKL